MRLLRRSWPYIVLGLLLLANVTVWLQRDAILDWWSLRNYTAPSQIVQLASDASMTPYARRLYYSNHPLLESREEFNKDCTNYGEETAVLGCYHGRRQGIFIYAVDDPRLQGVLQVTAAHEMLHEAYDRLGTAERSNVKKMLETYAASGKLDSELNQKLDSYRQQNADVVNEMHSIFGTEVRSLPPDLEAYYKKYFTNRLRVVEYKESYQAEFSRRKALVDNYDAQLADLKTQIDSHKASLTAKLSELKAKEKTINQAIANQNRSAYDSAVRSYNNLVSVYNQELAVTQKLIAQYNDIVARRNEIATQERQLQEALDSRFVPSRQSE